LHAVGLFTELSTTATGDKLRAAVETYLRERPSEIVLHAPQAIRDVPGTVGLRGVIVDEPDPHYVTIRAEGRTTTYKPRTHHEWVGVFNAALAATGDARVFAAFDVEDFEEPIYVLVTEPQRAALDAAGLLAYDSNLIRAPVAVAADERARELVEGLRLKGVVARAASGGASVVVDVDLEGARRLVARLRADLHHDARVGAYVKAAYGSKDA
jgi:hypothetical protein